MSAMAAAASASPPTSGEGAQKKGKKRVRSFTAEERASHRIIEKQRREALNESFLVRHTKASCLCLFVLSFPCLLTSVSQELARLIPALAQAQRLSKSLIVAEGATRLRTQRKLCLEAATGIQTLLQENHEILTELNGWRLQNGHPEREAPATSEAIMDLLKLHNDTFGTFPGGFGDNAQLAVVGKPNDFIEDQVLGQPGQVDQVSMQPQVNHTSEVVFNPPHAPRPQLPGASVPIPPIQHIVPQEFNVLPAPLAMEEPLDEMLQYLDNEYGTHFPPAETDQPPHFGDMNLLPNSYNDVTVSIPQNEFYMQTPVETRNLFYHTGNSTQ